MTPSCIWERNELWRLVCGIAMMGVDFVRISSIVRTRPLHLCQKQAKMLAEMALGGGYIETPEAAARVIMAQLHVEPPVKSEFNIPGAAVDAYTRDTESHISFELLASRSDDYAAVCKKGFNPSLRTQIKARKTVADLLMQVFEKWDLPIVLLRPDGELLLIDETATEIHSKLANAKDTENTVQLNYRVINVDLDSILEANTTMQVTVAQAQIPPAVIDSGLPIPPLLHDAHQENLILPPPPLPPSCTYASNQDAIAPQISSETRGMFNARPLDSALSMEVSWPPEPPVLPSSRHPFSSHRGTARKRLRIEIRYVPPPIPPPIPLPLLLPLPPPLPPLPPLPPELPSPRRNLFSGSVHIQLNNLEPTMSTGLNADEGVSSSPSLFTGRNERLDNIEPGEPPEVTAVSAVTDSQPAALAPVAMVDGNRRQDSLVMVPDAIDGKTGNSQIGNIPPMSQSSISRNAHLLLGRFSPSSQDFDSLWGKLSSNIGRQSELKIFVPSTIDKPLNVNAEPANGTRDDADQAVFSGVLKSTSESAENGDTEDTATAGKAEDKEPQPTQNEPNVSGIDDPEPDFFA